MHYYIPTPYCILSIYFQTLLIALYTSTIISFDNIHNMGNTTNPECSNTTRQSEPIRSFYYLNRGTNSILRVQMNSVSKHSLQDFKVFPQSAIGYLPNGHIVVAGGQKSSGRLSKKVFYINTLTKDINRLASLRYPTKSGTLIYYASQLYYFSPDLCDQHQVYSKKCWKSIKNSTLQLKNPSIYIRKGLAYFLCGIKSNCAPTKKIYYLNLSEKTPTYQIYQLRFPIRLEKPVVLTNNNCLILTGGCKTNAERNCNFFFHWFGSEKWKEIPGPDFTVEDYPGVYTNEAMIWVGFPKIVMICKNRFHIFNLKESQNQIVNITNYKSARINRVCPELKKCKSETYFYKSETKSAEQSYRRHYDIKDSAVESIPTDREFNIMSIPHEDTENNLIASKEIENSITRKKSDECKLELNYEETVAPLSIQTPSIFTGSPCYSQNPLNSISQVILEY